MLVSNVGDWVCSCIILSSFLQTIPAIPVQKSILFCRPLKASNVNFTPTYRSGGFRIQCYLSPSFILLFDTGNPVRLYSLTPVFHPGFSSLSLHLKQHVPPYFCFFCHSDVFGRVPLRGLFHPAIPGSRKERSGVPLPQCSLLR